jgi:hypothetical protein
MQMGKIDVKKELKTLYQPPANEVVRIDVPAMNFFMVDGEGDPNTSQPFKEAVETLYTLYKRSEKHHEIYLSDIRKANPQKWKTVIRQPMVGG